MVETAEHDPELRRNAEATRRLHALVARLEQTDLERSLGGGWTVGFALVQLAFWDARQHFARQSYARGDGFPPEDKTVNDALEAVAPLFRAPSAGREAVRAAQLIDATGAALPAAQRASLVQTGLGFAVQRWPHRDEHVAQIEGSCPEQTPCPRRIGVDRRGRPDIGSLAVRIAAASPARCQPRAMEPR